MVGSAADARSGLAEKWKVDFWRGSLGTLAVLNTCLFSYALLTYVLVEGEYTQIQRLIQFSAFPYVWQTTWRCIFISEYVDRHTIGDHPLNSVLLARIFAAVGEFTFGIQLAFALRTYTSDVALAILPLDFIGQVFATSGTITRSNLCFLCEGILWTLIFAVLCGVAAVTLLRSTSLTSEATTFLRLVVAFTVPGMVYMVGGYIPLCFAAWSKESEAQEKCKEDGLKKRRPIGELAWEALVMRVPTMDWAVWQGEVVWQTLYFAIGTWSSVWLMAYPPS